MTKTKGKSRLGTSIVVAALFVGTGYWVITNFARHSIGRAVDTEDKWSTPRRMTKPVTSDRHVHNVKFIVEALPKRDLMIHAIAGTTQSWGPAGVDDVTRWSWTARGVRTGEFASMTAEELSSKERGALRCWIEIDGKLYRNAGKDDPYDIIGNTSGGEICSAQVYVG